MKFKEIYNKFIWFNKYHGGYTSLGGRTSKQTLKWHIKDKDEMCKFLETFYNPCPYMPFAGESEYEQYYLLKPNWEVVKDLLVLKSLFKWKTIYKFPKYIWWTIIDIRNIKDDQEWYMNPTPIRKRK